MARYSAFPDARGGLGFRLLTGAVLLGSLYLCCLPATDGLTAWSAWSSCSASCGGAGAQNRSRSCQPNPNCTAALSETRVCTKTCPVHGGWSAWTGWQCSVTCGGGGVFGRRRRCNMPTPSSGGRNCSGNATQVNATSCNVPGCPTNGGWSAWVEQCDAFCGGNSGVRSRVRTCDSPAPSQGGIPCIATGAILSLSEATVIGNCTSGSCTPTLSVPSVPGASQYSVTVAAGVSAASLGYQHLPQCSLQWNVSTLELRHLDSGAALLSVRFQKSLAITTDVPIAVEDTGEYVCVANGLLSNETYNLTIVVPLQLTMAYVLPRAVYASQQYYSQNCSVVGHPAVSAEWVTNAPAASYSVTTWSQASTGTSSTVLTRIVFLASAALSTSQPNFTVQCRGRYADNITCTSAANVTATRTCRRYSSAVVSTEPYTVHAKAISVNLTVPGASPDLGGDYYVSLNESDYLNATLRSLLPHCSTVGGESLELYHVDAMQVVNSVSGNNSISEWRNLTFSSTQTIVASALAGSYECRAKTGRFAYEVAASIYHLTVHNPAASGSPTFTPSIASTPPRVSSPGRLSTPEVVSITEDSTVVIACPVTSDSNTTTTATTSSPQAAVLWYGPAVRTRQASNSNFLSFAAVKSSDAGRYWCSGRNAQGRRVTAVVDLRVSQKSMDSHVIWIIVLSVLLLLLVCLAVAITIYYQRRARERERRAVWSPHVISRHGNADADDNAKANAYMQDGPAVTPRPCAAAAAAFGPQPDYVMASDLNADRTFKTFASNSTPHQQQPDQPPAPYLEVLGGELVADTGLGLGNPTFEENEPTERGARKRLRNPSSTAAARASCSSGSFADSCDDCGRGKSPSSLPSSSATATSSSVARPSLPPRAEISRAPPSALVPSAPPVRLAPAGDASGKRRLASTSTQVTVTAASDGALSSHAVAAFESPGVHPAHAAPATPAAPVAPAAPVTPATPVVSVASSSTPPVPPVPLPRRSQGTSVHVDYEDPQAMALEEIYSSIADCSPEYV